LDISTFYRRSRLPDSEKDAIIAELRKDMSQGARSVARATGVEYGSVRLAYGYLGVNAKELSKAAQEVKDAPYLARVRRMSGQGSSAREIGKLLGISQGRVSAMMKRHGVVKAKKERHGTAVEYNRGCRCEECKAHNAARHRAGAVDRMSRPEEIPHGTESGYVNWYCRCGPCSSVGRAKLRERQAVRGDGSRVGELWTEGELGVVIDYEAPARKHAESLGRSVGGIYGARKYRGIKGSSRPRVKVL
jgi:hypothetical protein